MSTQADLRESYYCASEVIRERRRRGQPIPVWLRQHHARLDAEVRMSRVGRESTSDRPQLKEDELITAREAAEILDVSKRQAQRLAPDLDGRIVGGRWLFSKAVVVGYAEGKRNA